MSNKSIRQFVKSLLPNSVMGLLYFIKYRKYKLTNAKSYQNTLKNLSGIEIGGPSVIFRVILPIYQAISNLDGVNFSNITMWEGAIGEGDSFKYYKNKTGKQFITEATDLKGIKSDGYDFLLSSNCLEHVANPLKAMKEWVRVVKNDGYLLLVLPKKESNFDHKRPVTAFEHILEDYKNSMSEHDLTHLDEILELHDLTRDHAAGSHEQFKARSLNNFSNRGLHHHVFDQLLIKKMFEYFKIDIVETSETSLDYFALGKVRK